MSVVHMYVSGVPSISELYLPEQQLVRYEMRCITYVDVDRTGALDTCICSVFQILRYSLVP